MNSEASVRTLIGKVLAAKHPETVGQLAGQIIAEGGLDEDEFVEAVKALVRERTIVLNTRLRSCDIPRLLVFLYPLGVAMGSAGNHTHLTHRYPFDTRQPSAKSAEMGYGLNLCSTLTRVQRAAAPLP